MWRRLATLAPGGDALGLARLAADAPECVRLVLRDDGRVLGCNAAMADLLGRPRQAVAGLAWAEVLSPAAVAWLDRAPGPDVGWQGPGLVHLIDAQGHPFTVRAVTRRQGEGVTLLGVTTTTHDLRLRNELLQLNNELAVASRELARQRFRLQQLVEESDARNRALQVANERIEKLARTDPLTGLPNRRVLAEALARELERARRTGRPLAVVMVDLDHFKRVNDRWGHDAGDRLLVAVGGLLGARLRQTDLAARLGGEEFALLLPETDGPGAAGVAEALRQRLAQHLDHGLPVAQTASFGVAAFDGGPEGPDDLLRRADQALYAAKARGRNCVDVAA